MAKQSGILPIEGTIGNITFYKAVDGYLVKGKSSVSRSRRQTDPAFVRTRECNEEFGRACKASRLVRAAFRGISINTGDSRVTGRLVKTLVSMIRSDNINPRGKREILSAQAIQLQGFDFNNNATITTRFRAQFIATITRSTGEVSLTIDAFNPRQMLARPEGATHFRFVMGGCSINFSGQQYQTAAGTTGYLPCGIETTPQNLSVHLHAASTHPLFAALGLEYFQKVNGKYYTLKNGEFNMLGIVKVDIP